MVATDLHPVSLHATMRHPPRQKCWPAWRSGVAHSPTFDSLSSTIRQFRTPSSAHVEILIVLLCEGFQNGVSARPRREAIANHPVGNRPARIQGRVE